jgi:hypothetical protein
MKNPITAPPREVTPDGFKVYCAYDEIVEIDSLKPNPRNPNRHPEAQVKMLARIIGEQGWRAPITVSRRSGYIVRGHARRLAGYEAGSQYAPIEWQDYDNDSAEMADLVADNRIAELAVLDQDAIAGILAELKENTDDLDPELSGFTTEQIEDMIAGSQPDREAEEQAARLTLGEKDSLFRPSPSWIPEAAYGPRGRRLGSASVFVPKSAAVLTTTTRRRA